MQTVLIIVGAVIGVIAFIVGMVKAFSRLSWGALMWGIVASVWLTVETGSKDNHPFLGMVKGVKLFEGAPQFLASLILILVISVAVFVLFWIFALLLRPNVRKESVVNNYIYKNGDDEYDPYAGTMCANKGVAEGYEQVEDESEEEFKKKNKTKRTKPNWVDRAFGGVFALVEALLVYAGVVSVLLLIAKFTPMSKTFSDVYTGILAEDGKVWNFVQSYAMDLFFVAVIMGIAYGGFKAGFLIGVKKTVSGLGTLLAFALACALPFMGMPLANELNGFFSRFVVNNIKVEMIKNYADIVGKIFCGILLFIIILIAVKLFAFLLGIVLKGREASGLFKTVDGIFGFVVSIAIALVIIFLLCALFYVLEYTGAEFKFSSVIGKDSKITKGFYAWVEDTLKPILDKWVKPSLAV